MHGSVLLCPGTWTTLLFPPLWVTGPLEKSDHPLTLSSNFHSLCHVTSCIPRFWRSGHGCLLGPLLGYHRATLDRRAYQEGLPHTPRCLNHDGGIKESWPHEGQGEPPSSHSNATSSRQEQAAWSGDWMKAMCGAQQAESRRAEDQSHPGRTWVY
jgi:hypothetical protein